MEVFFNCLIYGGLAWGAFGLVRHVVDLDCKTPSRKNDFQNLLTGIGERPLPDIEKDPLAIEINKAYREHRDRLYVSPNRSDIQKKIDAIEMVFGLPVLRSVNDLDQIYIPTPLIDSGELRSDIKKRGPFIDLV